MSSRSALSRSAAAALALGAALALQDVSRSHGGAYRGPSDPAPPPSGPADTVPAAGGSGPPGSASPSPVGKKSGGSTPAGAQPGTPGTPTAPATPTAPGTQAGLSAVDPLDWSHWWELNKDAYLELKSHLYDVDVPTGSDRFFLGGWPTSMLRDSLRPTPNQVRDEVVPALLEALSEETHNEIITGCLIALARTGRTEDPALGKTLREAFLPFLADRNQEIAETAALALGILADDGSVGTLRNLLLDTAEGRRLVERGEVHYRTRAFAAYGLSLIGQRTEHEAVRAHVVSTLFRALHEDRSAAKDVGVACVVALGKVPLENALPVLSTGGGGIGPRESWDPASCRVAQVDALLAFFEDGHEDFLVRAHVPVAIASLLEGLPPSVRGPLKYRVAASFLERLGRKADDAREVSQGCVIALGLMGDSDEDRIDERIRKSLLGLGSGSDLLARSLACISLAEIAARPGEGPGAGSGREAIEADLLRRLEGGTSERPWAALALGVLGRADAAGGRGSRGTKPEIARALTAALVRARSPHELSALAIATGMAAVEDALPVLHEKIEGLSVDDDRGYVVLAMGLLGRRDSAALVQGIARESRYRPTLLRQAAVALGLLGDKSAVPELLEMMAAARGLSTQAATASALGFIGDSRSIRPLLEVLKDEERYTDGARGFAAVALGLVSDDSPLPWNASFSAHLNYRASPPTLNDDQGTGLLNIL